MKAAFLKVLKILNVHGKVSSLLVDGHGEILWSLIGFFPDWLHTYCNAPNKYHKNIVPIEERIRIPVTTLYQVDSLILMHKGRLFTVGYLFGHTCVKNLTCKLGCIIQYSKKQWKIHVIPAEPLFDKYLPELMSNTNNRNNIVVLCCNGKIEQLLCHTIIT